MHSYSSSFVMDSILIKKLNLSETWQIFLNLSLSSRIAVSHYIKQLHLKWAPPSWKCKALTESSLASHLVSLSGFRVISTNYFRMSHLFTDDERFVYNLWSLYTISEEGQKKKKNVCLKMLHHIKGDWGCGCSKEWILPLGFFSRIKAWMPFWIIFQS